MRRRASAPVLGASDCERVREGSLAQPANAVSSLAYVVVGIEGLARGGFHRRMTGAATVAAGLGSFAYHGPMPRWARFAHDVPLVCIPAFAVAAGTGRRRAAAAYIAATIAPAVTLARYPDAAPLAALAAGGLGLAASRPRPITVALLAAAGVLYALGRTGGPLCDPDSLLQPHAGWHVLTALALRQHAAGLPGS